MDLFPTSGLSMRQMVRVVGELAAVQDAPNRFILRLDNGQEIPCVLVEGDARQGGWLSGQSWPGSALLSSLGPFTVSIWALLIAVIWTVGSGAEYIREAIPLLNRPRPLGEAMSRAAEEL